MEDPGGLCWREGQRRRARRQPDEDEGHGWVFGDAQGESWMVVKDERRDRRRLGEVMRLDVGGSVASIQAWWNPL